MAVLQRGQLYQAADQAPLVSQVKIGQAGWSQAVVACLQPRGFNLGLNPKQHLLLELLLPEVVVMMHLGALSFYRLAQERGNKG